MVIIIFKYKNSDKTYLYDPHRKSSFLGELLTDVPGWFGCLREGCFQDLQLLRLDGGPGAAPLRATVSVVRRPVLRLRITRLRITVHRTLMITIESRTYVVVMQVQRSVCRCLRFDLAKVRLCGGTKTKSIRRDDGLFVNEIQKLTFSQRHCVPSSRLDTLELE